MPTKILHKERLIPGRTSKLVLDAPQNAISTLSGRIGRLKGVTSKATYAKV